MSTKKIRSREDALSQWDEQTVLMREVNGYWNVYPALGRGSDYSEFELSKNCVLRMFTDKEQAMLWATNKGYEALVVK